MARMTTTVRHKTDPRELPSYSLAEAAHYLCIPVSTLRSWVVGRHYFLTKDKRRFFEPLIHPSQSSPYTLLSFVNLVEIHILNAIRRQHKISLNKK